MACTVRVRFKWRHASSEEGTGEPGIARTRHAADGGGGGEGILRGLAEGCVAWGTSKCTLMLALPSPALPADGCSLKLF